MIYATWKKAVIGINEDGVLSFEAELDVMDDTLGKLGQRGLTPPPEAAAAVAAQVRPFMEALLPQMSAFAGMPVMIAPAPDAVVTPTPKPPIGM